LLEGLKHTEGDPAEECSSTLNLLLCRQESQPDDEAVKR